MSNSSRIQEACKNHVGQTLSAAQIEALVKQTYPGDVKGTYPGDAAAKRTPEGLVHRGKQQYGDLVLELVAPNQYRVLATDEIVRMKSSGRGSREKGTVVVPPPNAPSVPVPPAPSTEEAPKATGKVKKAA